MALEPPAPIAANLRIRVLVSLIAAWSVVLGFALVASNGSDNGALSAGIDDPAGRRLAGMLMLVLLPAYVLIVLRPRSYGVLLWLPICAQAGIAFSVAYSMLRGDSSFADSFLAMAVSGGLAGFLGFVLVSLQRTSALTQYERTQEVERDSDEEDPKA